MPHRGSTGEAREQGVPQARSAWALLGAYPRRSGTFRRARPQLSAQASASPAARLARGCWRGTLTSPGPSTSPRSREQRRTTARITAEACTTESTLLTIWTTRPAISALARQTALVFRRKSRRKQAHNDLASAATQQRSAKTWAMRQAQRSATRNWDELVADDLPPRAAHRHAATHLSWKTAAKFASVAVHSLRPPRPGRRAAGHSIGCSRRRLATARHKPWLSFRRIQPNPRRPSDSW